MLDTKRLFFNPLVQCCLLATRGNCLAFAEKGIANEFDLLTGPPGFRTANRRGVEWARSVYTASRSKRNRRKLVPLRCTTRAAVLPGETLAVLGMGDVSQLKRK